MKKDKNFLIFTQKYNEEEEDFQTSWKSLSYMKPRYVVYECENCGDLFYREVAEVITDDAENCAVKVTLITEKDTNDIEEFPMCECVGGDGGYKLGNVKDIPSAITAE